MKFRRNKIKREHSIIDGALEWLEDLSKIQVVTDIIPGVIDVTNSKERGIVYKYETPTGCKLLLKYGGAIQEAFVVTTKPQTVEAWVTRIMEELNLFQAAINEDTTLKGKKTDKQTDKGAKQSDKASKPKTPHKQKTASSKKDSEEQNLLIPRDKLLAGIKEEYQLVEINQGLRDSLVESLASMADLDNPKVEDALEIEMKVALEKLQKKLGKMPEK